MLWPYPFGLGGAPVGAIMAVALTMIGPGSAMAQAPDADEPAPQPEPSEPSGGDAPAEPTVPPEQAPEGDSPSKEPSADSPADEPSEPSEPSEPPDVAQGRPPPRAAPPDTAPDEAPSESGAAQPSPTRAPQPSAMQPAADSTDPGRATDAAAADATEIEAALRADEQAQDESDPPGGASPAAAGTQGTATGPAGGSGRALNPELSLILDFTPAYFSDDDNLQAGAHDPTQTGFNLQQLELSATSFIDPFIRFDAAILVELFGLEIEEAYGTTLSLPGGLQARFGQFLTRFGRINSMHLHTWQFADQPFAIGRVMGGDGNRGLGVELSWVTPLPWYVELIGSSTTANGETTARSFFGDRNPGVDDFGDLLHVAAIKQFFPFGPDWSLSWGVSGAFGPNATGRDNRTDVYGTDVYLKYRPITRAGFTEVSLQAEALYRRRQVPDELLQDANGYAQLFYRFARRWAVAGRYEWGSPEYDDEGSVPDDRRFMLDPEWTEFRHRVSANVSFWPSEFSRFRLQAARDMPGWRDDLWSVFLQMELVAGAHGAHQF